MAFVVGLAAVMAASGIGVAAWDAGYEARVLPGVHVGSVDLSGLDRAAASRAVSAAYPFEQGQIILRTPDGDVVIAYSAIGRQADADGLVDEALRAGRTGTAIERAVGEVRQALGGTYLEPRLLLDESALEAAVTTAVADLEVRPVDATIRMGPDGPLTTPSSTGRTANPAPIVATALEAARSLDAPAEVIIPVDVTTVEPARDDEAVHVAKILAQRLVNDVVVVSGKKSWIIEAETVRGWASFRGFVDGSVRPVIATVPIKDSLDAVSKGVLKKAKSATFLKARSGTVVGVVASKDGRQLDVEATVARIAAELEGRATGDLAAPVPAVVGPYQPKLTTEDATKTAPLMVKLGSWKTYFPISDRNYFGANIWLPARIINQTVLKPGQRFEWWSAVGPVTPARGFGPGGVIRSDH
ncbi:MAG: peptidoglycan binding domain-containing protein, partial [Chloroflexi bacterium]|nr:peptidoglycan binding domain-containing protein [Chloroflexota bacterium]